MFLSQANYVVEDSLQDEQLYSLLLSDCVEMGSTVSSVRLRQDQALTELKKEEQLTKRSRDLLQDHLSVLLGKLRSDSCYLEESRGLRNSHSAVE